MFPQVARTGLTLSKVLKGMNKTLTIANQIIPLYVEAKPMIQNMKGAFQIVGKLMNSPKPKPTPSKETTSNNKKIENQPNNPVFFIQ